MRRAHFLSRLTLVLCAMTFSLAAPLLADTRIVGMVVSSGPQNARAVQMLQSLTALDAEILQASDPSNAQLRAMMRRFAQEAAQADAAVVFLDMPAVTVGERLFVLSQDTQLIRASDIYTEAVPLRAFARITVLAGRGGAVILSATDPATDLPGGMIAAETAPEPLKGASEILVVPASRAQAALDVFEQATKGERIDLSNVLERMTTAPGATLSARPASPIILKAPQAPPPPVILPEVVAEPETAAPPTEEELALLEQSLSPPVKRNLQRALRAQGHYKGLIDGIIGVQTRAAIRGFQITRAEADTGLLTPRQLIELLAQG